VFLIPSTLVRLRVLGVNPWKGSVALDSWYVVEVSTTDDLFHTLKTVMWGPGNYGNVSVHRWSGSPSTDGPGS
jgi:hypothetical protein